MLDKEEFERYAFRNLWRIARRALCEIFSLSIDWVSDLTG